MQSFFGMRIQRVWKWFDNIFAEKPGSLASALSDEMQQSLET